MKLTRRSFLGVAGLVATLCAHVRSALARDRQARPPFRVDGNSAPPPPGDVLQASDFTYLGMFKMPADTLSQHYLANGVYCQNQFTGRTVGGVTTLIMGASNSAPGGSAGMGLYEMNIPADGDLTTDISTAPHTTGVRTWQPAAQYGSIYDGAVTVPNAGPPDNGYPILLGLGFAGPYLVSIFGSNYSYIGEWPNLVETLLNDDGTYTHYGPWGCGDIPKFSGNPMAMPASVIGATGCGPFGLCAAVNGSQASSPRGSNWATFNMPAITDPPDPLNMATATITKQQAILHDQGHPQARNTNAYNCSANVPNQQYVDAPTCDFPGGRGGPTIFEPFYGGYNGHDAVLFGVTTLDWTDSGAWIEGPNKAGVIFLSQLCETISVANGFSQDLVYGGWKYTPLPSPPHPPGSQAPTHDSACAPMNTDQCHAIYGASICGHGHLMISSATGPGADSLANYFYIYDPADLIAILNGASVYGATPVVTAHASVIGLPETRGAINLFAGLWYDSAHKRLYISQRTAYAAGFDNLPAIHVFAVNC